MGNKSGKKKNGTLPPVPPFAASASAKRGTALMQAATTDTFSTKKVVPIKRGPDDDLELGLQWDILGGKEIDMDASAVIFSEMGVVIDAAYFNQVSACSGTVVHSGDNRSGHGDGDDEAIRIDIDDLEKKHPEAHVIVFCINIHGKGSFKDVESARAVVRDLSGGVGDSKKTDLFDFSLGGGGSTSCLVACALFKDFKDGQWRLGIIDQAASGRDFKESLPNLRNACDIFLEDWVRAERSAKVLSTERVFKMKKGDTASLPAGLRSVKVGLGWDCRKSFDLDASVVFLDKDGNVTETVYFGHKNSSDGSVVHAGDNTTGAGSGDDETIAINLDRVQPSKATSLYVVVNIYSNGTFRDVSNAYVRLVHKAGSKELARYELKSSITSRGIIFCRLYRQHRKGAWGLEAIGSGCGGKSAIEHATVSAVKSHACKARC